METKALSPEMLHKMDACRCAANYRSVGQFHRNDLLLGGDSVYEHTMCCRLVWF